jgi:hypothetical protein
MQNTICKFVDVCALKTKLNTKTLLVVLFSLVLAACESSSGSDGDPTDAAAPVIIMLGADPLSLSVGDTYIDPGATATDDTDGDITVSIVVAGDTYSAPGVTATDNVDGDITGNIVVAGDTVNTPSKVPTW